MSGVDVIRAYGTPTACAIAMDPLQRASRVPVVVSVDDPQLAAPACLSRASAVWTTSPEATAAVLATGVTPTRVFPSGPTPDTTSVQQAEREATLLRVVVAAAAESRAL